MNEDKLKEVFTKGSVHLPGDGTLSESEYRDLSTDRTSAHTPRASAIAFPRTLEEVTALVHYAVDHRVALVPSGGRTGYAGGAVAAHGEIVVSFTRMNRILQIDPLVPSIRAEAGVITDTIQAQAHNEGFYFPLDFAATGSSTIGGNAATNAGGMRVIRYGTMRKQVLGMTMVDGQGQIHRWNGKVEKNNTGYDLMQLVIGSEGTLGLITDLTLRLVSPPGETELLLFSVTGAEGAVSMLEATRRSGAPVLAFEYFNGPALAHVREHLSLPAPFSERSSSHVLMEIEKSESTDVFLEEILMNDYIRDAIQAQSAEQRRSLWSYREGISEAISGHGLYKNDVSIPASALGAFFKDLPRILSGELSRLEPVIFGHLGDGNLHLNFLKPDDMTEESFASIIKELEAELYPFINTLDGSVSAEHGIGLLKKHLLPFSRSKTELEIMRSIKKAFDPHGVLNPGKIFDP